jgi:phage shock protein A
MSRFATRRTDVTTLDRQTQRKLDRLRETESRWLQKAAFALGKTREARAKLDETIAEPLAPVITLDDGSTVTLDEVETQLRLRVEELRSTPGEGNFRFGPS